MILAQADGTAAGGGLGSLLFLVAMVAVFWLLFIRPQRKRMRQQQELQAAIATGDRVQTLGGIQGRVITVEEDAVLLEVESGKIRVSKRAISARLNGNIAES